jgi:hypothetical protein
LFRFGNYLPNTGLNPQSVAFWVQLGHEFLMEMAKAAAIFFTFLAGESLFHSLGRNAVPLWDEFLQKRFPRNEIFERLCVGYSAGFGGIGFVTIFFLVAMEHFTIWKPIASGYGALLGLGMPFLSPLTGALTDAVWQETIRMFLIGFFAKYLRSHWAGILLSAVYLSLVFGGVAISPVGLRVLELSLLGTVFGWILWRYGWGTAVLAQFVYLAMLQGTPLWRSPNVYFSNCGSAMILVIALPAILAGLFAPISDIKNFCRQKNF